jgi:hypothetical protein
MKKIGAKKLFLSLIITLIIGGALAFLFINDFGVIKFIKLKKELSQVQKEIIRADFVLDSLKTEIDSLKLSKRKIEQVAREKFDMLRKNERVLKVIEK